MGYALFDLQSTTNDIHATHRQQRYIACTHVLARAMLCAVRNTARLLTSVAYTLTSSHASQCRKGAPILHPPTDEVPCIIAGLSLVRIAASAV